MNVPHKGCSELSLVKREDIESKLGSRSTPASSSSGMTAGTFRAQLTDCTSKTKQLKLSITLRIIIGQRNIVELLI